MASIRNRGRMENLGLTKNELCATFLIASFHKLVITSMAGKMAEKLAV